MERIYASIDLKSFYASVECKERGLDPLKTNLVVADDSRTEKTICLAVSPSLKAYGIPGRARLYEVIQKVKAVNNGRKIYATNHTFTGKSYDDIELKKDKNLELAYIIAPPRMAHYMEYSTKIYNIYLKYISSEDIFPYSIDEIFCDLTNYLKTYQMTAKELVTKIIRDVTEENQNCYKILQLYLNTLYTISETDKDPELILAIFKMKLLCFLGFTPRVTECTNCTEKEKFKFFSIKDNGFKCDSCAKQDKSCLNMSESTKNAIKYIVLSPAKKLYSFNLKDESLNELKLITKVFFDEKLEKQYKM